MVQFGLKNTKKKGSGISGDALCHISGNLPPTGVESDAL